MSENAITIQNVSKSYGRVQALRQLELAVQRNEIFGYLGPNGAGKTTTIRCLLDLIRPEQGEIRVLGIDPRRDPVEVRSRCGYLPGELSVDDNMTVKDVLRFFINLRGGKRAGRPPRRWQSASIWSSSRRSRTCPRATSRKSVWCRR